jgi:predicted acylesterase/phospholipase RssA
MAKPETTRPSWTARLRYAPVAQLVVLAVPCIILVWFPISLYRQSASDVLKLYLLLAFCAVAYSVLFLLVAKTPLGRKVPVALAAAAVFAIVWSFIGSPSLTRDAVAALLAVPIAILGVPRARRRLFSWRRTEPPPPLTDGDAVSIAIGFLAVAWVLFTVGDRLAEPVRVGQRATQAVARARPSAWPHARLGIALSGGGYRAALYHAGVLSALEEMGVPVQVMSTVSGGSIIGAFYARGGTPSDFVDAMIQRRFNLKRNMLHIDNALHLLASARVPLVNLLNFETTFLLSDRFSRTDVQAELLDRVLFDGAKQRGSRIDGRPELMVATTDLVESVMVGVTPDGVVYQKLTQPLERLAFANPVRWKGQLARPAYLPSDAFDLPGDQRLASIVAASGAFPGAFNAYSVAVSIGDTLKLRESVGYRNRTFLLADGGVADNYGMVLLSAARQLARGNPDVPPANGFSSQPQPPVKALERWDVDVMLVSDGSAFAMTSKPQTALGELGAAIDLMYSNGSGPEMFAAREVAADARTPLILISPRSRTSVPTIYESTQEYLDFGHLDLSTQKTGADSFFLPGVTLLNLEPATLQYFIDQMGPIDRALARELIKLLVAQHKITPEGWAGPLDPYGDPPSPERKLWQLVSKELGVRMRAFVRTSTLDDQIDRETAMSIYMLGRYETLFNKPYILCHLERSERHRMPPNMSKWTTAKGCAVL